MTWTALLWLAGPLAAEGIYPVNPQLRQPVELPACLKGKTFFLGEVSGGGGNSTVRTARSWTSPNPAWLPPGVNFNRELKMEDLFWQRDPTEVVREALVQSFTSGGSLAAD